MKKLILQMQISVDGFVSAERPVKWQVWNWSGPSTWDKALKEAFNDIFIPVDTILLSRKMALGGYIDHWTDAANSFSEDPFFNFARRIVSSQKVVFSSQHFTPRWERTVGITGDLSEQINQLKYQEGGDILCFGGTGFASSLLSNGLVDELQLFINPGVIIQGGSIFRKVPNSFRMRLIGSESYDCGIVINKYKPYMD
jgi:dihydrofolate reductase